MLRLALAALLAAALSSGASAQERITSYESDVHVARNGTLDVTETIEVISEGISIRHGIYRDFPTTRRVMGQPGNHVGFKLLDVRLDGEDEPFEVETIKGGVRVRVGSADEEVPAGAHRYVIHYETTRQIGYFKDFDELYWNATGNDWAFPIDRVVARITLPSPARFIRKASYTGAAGSTANMARITAETADSITFQSTAPLAPHEGMTIAAGWPKGIVQPPSASSRLMAQIAEWLPWLLAAGGMVWVLSYYAGTWLRIGRDPRKGTVVPLFSPPDDMSPAALRYVLKRTIDNRAVAASLVDMGVKGKVRLVEEDGGFFKSDTKRIDKVTDDTGGLSQDEAKLFYGLLSGTDSLKLEQENHSIFSTARKGVEDSLKAQFGERFYIQNLGPSMMGCARLAVLAAGLLIVLVILEMLVDGVGPASALQLSSKLPLLLLLPAIPIALVAFVLMGAPTKEGRMMMDRIEGFKHYLSVTERDRFDRMQAPEETLTLFEKYLPYAIALGVETRWADRFESQIAAALASPAAQGSSFAWYSGHSNPWNDVGGFTESIGNSLASSIGTASSSPSSGSGGGGSSGGGGGGGGGGGW